MPMKNLMAKKIALLYTGVSESEKVDSYLREFSHPLSEVVIYLRQLFLSSDNLIGEGIYWNAPTFFYTGPLPDFDPKSYKRYLVGFVFNKQDCLRLVFLHGAEAEDPQGLLEGTYTDGRRLMTITDLADAKKKAPAIKKILGSLLKAMK
jgi:hypothetical protein